jgi:hypothetical protein
VRGAGREQEEAQRPAMLPEAEGQLLGIRIGAAPRSPAAGERADEMGADRVDEVQDRVPDRGARATEGVDADGGIVVGHGWSPARPGPRAGRRDDGESERRGTPKRSIFCL